MAVSFNLPPPPVRGQAGDFVWTAWQNNLYKSLSSPSSITWTTVDKAGSSIADLANHDHALLTNIQGGNSTEKYHLTNAEYTGTGTGPFVRSTGATLSNVTLTNTSLVQNISVTAPLSSTGGTTPTINITTANATTNGSLSFTDWNTFNNKSNVTIGGNTTEIQYNNNGSLAGSNLFTFNGSTISIGNNSSASNQMIFGNSTGQSLISTHTITVQTAGAAGIGFARSSINAASPVITMAKTRSGTGGVYGNAAINGDQLGIYRFAADTGSSTNSSALASVGEMRMTMCGTVSNTSLPTRFDFYTTAQNTTTSRIAVSILESGIIQSPFGVNITNGSLTLPGSTLLNTTAALTNGAAASIGTLTNAPAAGNPTKWIPINDAGTTRYIPAW